MQIDNIIKTIKRTVPKIHRVLPPFPIKEEGETKLCFLTCGSNCPADESYIEVERLLFRYISNIKADIITNQIIDEELSPPIRIDTPEDYNEKGAKYRGLLQRYMDGEDCIMELKQSTLDVFGKSMCEVLKKFDAVQCRGP